MPTYTSSHVASRALTQPRSRWPRVISRSASPSHFRRTWPTPLLPPEACYRQTRGRPSLPASSPRQEVPLSVTRWNSTCQNFATWTDPVMTGVLSGGGLEYLIRAAKLNCRRSRVTRLSDLGRHEQVAYRL